jgi:hypothetical protein
MEGAMAKSKVESTKKANWGDLGGDGHMHTFSGTGTQKPGQTTQAGSGSKRGIEPQAGPSNVIGYSSGATNADYAGTQAPGVSGRTKTGGDKKWAEGGKSHMFGHRGSQKAVPGQSGPNG